MSRPRCEVNPPVKFHLPKRGYFREKKVGSRAEGVAPCILTILILITVSLWLYLFLIFLSVSLYFTHNAQISGKDYTLL